MLNAARNVRIFISSPGDLFDERIRLRDAINDMRNSNEFGSKYNLIPLLYEDTTPALVGLPPNTIIRDFMVSPEEADILVCIFWSRFGSNPRTVNPATNRPYGSGTEEEFLTAYMAFRANGRKPQIMLYRCVRDPSTAPNYDPKQYEQVVAFFARFESGGDLDGLVRSFTDSNLFVSMFRTDLARVIRATFQPVTAPTVKTSPSTVPSHKVSPQPEDTLTIQFSILADSLRTWEAQVTDELLEKANALYSSTYRVRAEPNIVDKETAKLSTLLADPTSFIVVLVGAKLFAQEFQIYKEHFERQGHIPQAHVLFMFNRGPRDLFEVDSEHIVRIKQLREQAEAAGGTFYDYKDERTFRETIWYWICRTFESTQIDTLDVPSIPLAQHEIQGKRSPYFYHSVPFPKHYIQREDLRAAVAANMGHDSQGNSTPVTVLTGVGGTGKTTFCYELVREVYAHDATYKGLYWFNFNQVGIEGISTFFDGLSNYLDESTLPKLWKLDPYRCKDSILAELNATSFLIVLDGLESIQVQDPNSPKFGEVEDGLFRDFVIGMCESTQSRLVVVSRIAPSDIVQARGVTSFTIAQFTVNEAMKYLNERHMVGSEADLRALADHFGCHPLSLSIAAEYIGRYYMGDAQRFLQAYVSDVDHPVSERLGEILSDYWKHLTSSQQFLLSAIASLHRPLHLDDLATLAQLMARNSDVRTLKHQFREDLNALVDMSFVLLTASDGASQDYSVHPILKSLIRNTLSRVDQREEVSVLWALIERVRARELVENSPAELETRAREVQYLLDAGNVNEAVTIFVSQRLNARLFEAGRHDLGIPLGEQIYELAETIRISRPTADYLSGYLPDHYACVGRITRAVRLMKEIPIDDAWTALVDQTWILLRGGAYEFAKHVIDRAPEKRKTGEMDWVTAQVEYYRGERECVRHFNATLQDSEHLLSSYKVRLRTQFANALIDFNDVGSAQSTLDQVPRLVVGSVNPFPSEQTHADLARARIAFGGGDYNTALSTAQAVIETARSTGDEYSALCGLLFRVHVLLRVPWDFRVGRGHTLQANADVELREIQRILRVTSEGELNYGFPIEGTRFHLLLALKAILGGDGEEFDVQVDRAEELVRVSGHYWSRTNVETARAAKATWGPSSKGSSSRSWWHLFRRKVR
jgi:hypothetical protein